MIINKRCTTCSEALTADDIEICETCGHGVHDRCAVYEMTYECPRCATDGAIGALEF
jgi:rRNA maturation endonuclease Nob1